MTYLRSVSVLAAALLLVLATAACGGGGYGGGGKKSEEGGSTTIGGMTAELHGTKDVSSESKAEIDLYDNYFEPTILKGKPGEKVTVELKNEGKVAHTFTISDQNVDLELQPDKKGEADVTFPKSGVLTFVCKFHESGGMVGALAVSSASSSSSNTTSSSKY
jgi:plastocyanin